MYGTLLIIVKIISDALAAVFGMLGLLFDFKDKQGKVTSVGKIALIGIFASFVLSAVITGLEYKKSRDDAEAQEKAEASREADLKAAYEDGTRRVLRPFGEMAANFTFSTKKSKFDSVQREYVRVPKIYAMMLYKQSVPCGNPYGNRTQPDLVLSPQGSNDDAKHLILLHPSGLSPTMEQINVKLHIGSNNGGIPSVDDIWGSTLLVTSTDPGFYEYFLDGLDLDLAPGVHASVPRGKFTEYRADNSKQRVFCYPFPH
jgi:hypothetical protein